MSAAQWRLEERQHFVYRLWGDEGVVYDTRNGDTHLLNPVALTLLQVLDQSPADPSELAQRLADALTVPAEVDILALTEATLQQLRRIGLTKKISV